MKLKLTRKSVIVICVLNAIFFISKTSSWAQSFELAGTYTTSDADFYKNTAGISFAYSWHFKRQFVFVELQAAQKGNNSFTDFYRDIFGSYIVKSVNGRFSTSSVNIGAAQKLVTSNCLEFSVGAETGLNYYKQDNDYFSIGLDKERNEIIYFNTGEDIEKRKNKLGIGAFIDMELKSIIIDNLSIFSRLNLYHSEYEDKHTLRDDIPKTSFINSVSFRIGVKYRICSARD